MVASYSTAITWNLCEGCARVMNRYARLRVWCGILPAFACAMGAIIVAAVSSSRGGGQISDWAGYLLLAAFVIGLAGTAVPTLHQWLSRPTGKRISNRPAVRPLRYGRGVLSGRVTAIVDLGHPLYARAFAELNNGENVSFNPKRLQRVLGRWRNEPFRSSGDEGPSF